MLEMQLTWANQSTEARQKETNTLREDRDRLIAEGVQTSDWRRAAEQLELLTELIKQRNSKDLEESLIFRDRSKTLEGEHNALLKRFREQESKLSNIERASATTRQNLAQAQQRASDWEKRAADFESLHERAKQQAEQSEDGRRKAETETSTIIASNSKTQAEQQVK